MFTNRFSRPLFIALFLAAAVLTISFTTHSGDRPRGALNENAAREYWLGERYGAKPNADYSYDALERIRIQRALPAGVVEDRTYDQIEQFRTGRLPKSSATSNEQNTLSKVSQKFHSACVSEIRQGGCEESKPNLLSSLLSFFSNANPASYQSRKIHSDCVSEDSQRQDSCVQ